MSEGEGRSEEIDLGRAERRRRNERVFRETERICADGFYAKGDRTVSLDAPRRLMEAAMVFRPEKIKTLPVEEVPGPCLYGCEDEDAFSLARRVYYDPACRKGSDDRITVLNLASPTSPGGGVRLGADGQEEDLCRESTLLISLESGAARPFYDLGRAAGSRMGTDAVVFSPFVFAFRGPDGRLWDEPFALSVLTCAAPNIRHGLEGLTEEGYEVLLRSRIDALLRVASYTGCENLVLGAFGCGAFRNDPALVSDLFAEAFSGTFAHAFSRVDFAVLRRPGFGRNYDEFSRNFGKQG